jgi:hypothetical protein
MTEDSIGVQAMSMQADLRNPEFGYFDEGLKLTDARIYQQACLPFGVASTLPPVAYRSKVFLELENEMVWTRSWVVIGLLQQIPRPGDLLPLTLGFHGIHVQRQADGAIVARMNRHQHGGCRFVPEQCRTGAQTKCSITSCNYTRDADVMEGGENGENTDLMYKFVGLVPERLSPVKCETWGPFIFVNLDPECGSLSEYLGDLPEALEPDIRKPLTLIGKQWLDFRCNWKMVGSAITGIGTPPPDWVAGTCETPRTYAETKTAHAVLEPNLKLFWLFPNMLLMIGRDHIAAVLLQAAGIGKTLARCFLLTSAPEARSTVPEPFAEWISLLRASGAVAENMHREQVLLGTSSRPGTTADNLPREDNHCVHALNRFLAHRFQLEHHYCWNAPIMDAAMLTRGSR